MDLERERGITIKANSVSRSRSGSSGDHDLSLILSPRSVRCRVGIVDGSDV